MAEFKSGQFVSPLKAFIENKRLQSSSQDQTDIEGENGDYVVFKKPEGPPQDGEGFENKELL